MWGGGCVGYCGEVCVDVNVYYFVNIVWCDVLLVDMKFCFDIYFVIDICVDDV